MNKSWVLNSADEMETFNSRDFWTEEDGLIESLTLSLSPHSGLYYSDLSPIFSFEIQKFESLNLFSHIQLRDGAAFLLNFFLNNPRPQNLRTKISIHESLNELVPPEWAEQVQLAQLVSLKRQVTNRAYYLIGHEVGQDTLAHLKRLVDSGITEIIFLPSIIGTLGSTERANMGAQFILLSKAISKEIGQLKFRFEQLGHLDQRLVSQSLVTMDRDLFNFCSDSYVEHLLLSQGACTEASFSGDTVHFIELGLGYGYQLSGCKLNIAKNKEVWSFINKMKLNSSKDLNISREFGQFEQYLNPGLIDLGKALIEGKFFKK